MAKFSLTRALLIQESYRGKAQRTAVWRRTNWVLIKEITGMDGCYLAELSLSKGYELRGLITRANTFNTDCVLPNRCALITVINVSCLHALY